jgi:hypothetical protein
VALAEAEHREDDQQDQIDDAKCDAQPAPDMGVPPLGDVRPESGAFREDPGTISPGAGAGSIALIE